MLAINTTLEDRYRIVRPLGQGGMGAIYEAVDERFGEPIAIKEILVELSNENQMDLVLKAFKSEAKSLAKAQHEAIPFVRDYFSEQNKQFLVMELVEGDDLDELLKRQKNSLPLENVLDWTNQILDALDYLHTLSPPIIHRDIKPSNLKLNSRGKIKLLDFGIARIIDSETNVFLTQQTFMAATEEYSPIEQLLHAIPPMSREYFLLKHKEKTENILQKKTDARCDLYALGATVYHLLTNQSPIDSTKRILEIWEGNLDPLPIPIQLNPKIPMAISEWILKAMSIRRKDRFGSANEMKDALKNACLIEKPSEKETVPQLLNTVEAVIPNPKTIKNREDMKTEKKFREVTTEILNEQQTFTSKNGRKIFWLLPIGLIALFLLSGLSIGAWLIYKNINQGEVTSTNVNNPMPEETPPTITPPNEVSIDFFKSQYNKSRETRNSPTGKDAKVFVPDELRGGVIKQSKKIRQMRDYGYEPAMDYADLAQRIAEGKLVELPLATENFVLDLGGSTTRKEFTTFNLDDEVNSPVIKADSKDYKILGNFAENLSLKKYDLKNSDDRRKIKMRLLRTLHPKAKELLISIASEYKQKFDRPLRITSMTRSMEYQIALNKVNANSYRVRGKGSIPPHTTGYSFDIPYKFMDAEEQQFIINKLAKMEKSEIIEALREAGLEQIFHVFYLSGDISSPSASTGKTYQQMTNAEKKKFIALKSNDLLNRFGRINEDKISNEGFESIKKFLDGYVRRINKPRKNSCMQNDWISSDLTSVLERGQRNAAMINKAFKDKNLDPRIGIYLAMLESEFCACLQAPTGTLGIFQFTRTMGKLHGLETQAGASPTNPDDRCSPDKASKAAASYIDYILGYTENKFGKDYGRNAIGIPLAIAAFNSGEGAMNKNVRTVKELNNGKYVSFWKLMENKEKLSRQFQAENIKYIPKFFAASIIGENPETFGIKGVKALSKAN